MYLTDGLGLESSICLLFVNSTSPSLKCSECHRCLREPSGEALWSLWAECYGCFQKLYKLSLKILPALETPSGHEFRGLSKSFRHSFSKRKAGVCPTFPRAPGFLQPSWWQGVPGFGFFQSGNSRKRLSPEPHTLNQRPIGPADLPEEYSMLSKWAF